ncbi:hypothetical protein XM38_009510 [Halomicronema hongdechloris C2206]|uniref:Uncharacterized protein n=1 Tax=Halomicronema hongdechloris C2206 TaxID=1641165 RepID=A0A1Z3HIA7_9CYAN|nr:hypothetical protein XM38_009510 [Halomicronema hongdechloris C2206]
MGRPLCGLEGLESLGRPDSGLDQPRQAVSGEQSLGVVDKRCCLHVYQVQRRPLGWFLRHSYGGALGDG